MWTQKIGTTHGALCAVGEPQLLLEEPDSSFIVDCQLTKDRAYVLVSAQSRDSSEVSSSHCLPERAQVRALKMGSDGLSSVLLRGREHGSVYHADHGALLNTGPR